MPNRNLYLIFVNIKADTNPLIIQQHYAEIKSEYSDYSTMYTDGSKDGDKVASAALFGDLLSSGTEWQPFAYPELRQFIQWKLQQ